jgi:homoserine dehydrogenase
MSVVFEEETRERRVLPPPALRTIRVGIAGLGQVGQAVARLAPEAIRFREAGLRFRVVGALVREVDKPRRCLRPPRITSNPSAFLRGNYDVVIEALGAIEPARSIVGRLLERGIPVVTANKALVAAHGSELAALAARRGTSLRYEASALAGVPFLGALAARPLVSDVQQFTAVVNGTSNFILSTLDNAKCAFDEALAEARTLGLTEPDPSRDLDGLDTADKLALLSSIFGWGTLTASHVNIQGIRAVTPYDLAIARSLGGTIKPVVAAASTPAGISAFIGPALVPVRHPLASLTGVLSGIQLSGRFIKDLFFSGPGAGPDVTAATVLDDAVEAVTSAPKAPRLVNWTPRVATLAAPPATAWLIRARFPGLVPDASIAAQMLTGHHLVVRHVTDSIDDTRWILVGTATRDAIDRALTSISNTHRIQLHALRVVDGLEVLRKTSEAQQATRTT